MFKLALNAGHYKHSAGKRCHPDIDPNQTREWVLNDRICDKIETILSEYDGIEIYSFNKYLWSIFYVSSAIPGTIARMGAGKRRGGNTLPL